MATNQTGATTVPDLMAALQEAEIRKRIAQARKRADLTQPQLAELLSVHPRSVQNYENGGSGVPYGQLGLIAEVTGTTVKWLLHGDDDEATQLASRLNEFDQRLASVAEQTTKITEALERILPPDSDEPLTPERAAVMFTMLEQLQKEFQEWAQRMGRDQIGKNDVDRRTRRAAHATDHQRQRDEAAA